MAYRDPEKKKAYAKAYNSANREKIRRYKKEYQKADGYSERRKKYMDAYNENNKEKMQRYQSDYFQRRYYNEPEYKERRSKTTVAWNAREKPWLSDTYRKTREAYVLRPEYKGEQKVRRDRHRTNNPYARLVGIARTRAKKYGREFSITVSDLEWPEFCPALGIAIDYNSTPHGQRLHRKRDSAATLDRVDNSKGYVPGNVRVISHKANRLKADATAAELRGIVNYIESIK